MIFVKSTPCSDYHPDNEIFPTCIFLKTFRYRITFNLNYNLFGKKVCSDIPMTELLYLWLLYKNKTAFACNEA